MKTKFDVIIDADKETVWAAFDDTNKLAKWQPTLKSFTHKSGTPGDVGAISELVYDENGRDVVLLETITEKRRPAFMAGIYESEWGKSLVVNYFEPVGENQTRWVGHAHHAFRGIRKLVSPFMRKKICGRTDGDMQRFKLLVESQLASEAL
jgi:hypothetical protein